MRKYLVVVDMQNDFIDGSLGTKEAREILPRVVKKIQTFDGNVIFTKDTHQKNYLDSQEGQLLPVEHCIAYTEGWDLEDGIEELEMRGRWPVYTKNTFGCVNLAIDLKNENIKQEIESIELVGLCTDICVISNALLLKAYMPNTPIVVDASCCAGVTPETHKNALEAMRMCQIQIKGDDQDETVS